MDTNISEEVSQKRKKRTAWIVVFSVLALALATWGTRSLLRSSVDANDITVGTAEVGDIENTLTASGEILPEFEEIISSPVNASIKDALLDAGTAVKAGQAVLLLDKSAAESEYNKLKFGLETRLNEIRKLKLDLDKSFFDIKSNNSIKELRITNLEDAVENARRLYKAGGGTRESIEQAELNLKIAQLEKKQLENEIRSKQQTMQLEAREAEIAANIQRSELAELGRKLKLADVKATHEGVVTYLNRNIGSVVREGETLVRIADLRSFKIKGSISDAYLEQLHSGMPVIVRFNETQLRGSVVTVYPTVQNGIVSFDVHLSKGDQAQLRPNMKVDVYPVTDSRTHIVRINNGAAFKGAQDQDVFVVSGDRAARRRIKIGLSNFDFVEIVEGIKPGERVITSDMSAFLNTRELSITRK